MLVHRILAQVGIIRTPQHRHSDNVLLETLAFTCLHARLPRSCSDLLEVPKAHKGSRIYRTYLEALEQYLLSFYERAQPLGQARKQLVKVSGQFFQAGACL
eukprot:366393-Chlamydomonas_euryale.AAC.3